MYFNATYRRSFANDDGRITEVSADDDMVRVSTDVRDYGSTYLTNEQAEELIEMLSEAVYANRLTSPGGLQALTVHARAAQPA